MRDVCDDSLDHTEAELRSADLIQLRRMVGDAAFDTAYDADKALMLLWMSSGVFEEFEHASGEVALQAATNFAGAFAFRETTRGVGLGLLVADQP